PEVGNDLGRVRRLVARGEPDGDVGAVHVGESFAQPAVRGNGRHEHGPDRVPIPLMGWAFAVLFALATRLRFGGAGESDSECTPIDRATGVAAAIRWASLSASSPAR